MVRLTLIVLSISLGVTLAAGCDRGTKPDQNPGAGGQPSTADATEPIGETNPANAHATMPPSGDEAGPSSGEQGGSHVGESTREVLNARELANDPNWTVVASDPQQVQGFTVVGTAYNRAAALGGTVNLGKWIELEHASSGEWPTYDALRQYVARDGVSMPSLREYQHYGYDETTGKIVILENKAEKEGRRKELGLSPEE